MKESKRMALLLALGFLLTIFLSNQILLQNRLHEFELMGSLAAEDIAARLDNSRRFVELASRTQEVRACDAARAEAFLLEAQTAEPQKWSHFLLTDLEGIEFAHTEGSQHYGKSLAERAYFSIPRGQHETHIAQPTHSVSTGRKIIAIGTPVYQEDTISAILVGFIHLGYISDQINRVGITTNSYRMLLGADGSIAAHPQDEYVLQKNLTALLPDKQSQLAKDTQQRCVLSRVEGKLSVLTISPVPGQDLRVASVVPLLEAFSTPVLLDLILLLLFILFFLAYRAQRSLKRATRQAQKLSYQAQTDSLTGLYNRHWLDDARIEDLCREEFSVLFLDVDDFKQFNDLHNHAYGDAILRHLGEVLRENSRDGHDVCVRYAGDEFLILFRDLEHGKAEAVARRVMDQLAMYRNAQDEHDPIYISCGIASGRTGVAPLTDVILAADKATYMAKHQGKNKLVIV